MMPYLCQERSRVWRRVVIADDVSFGPNVVIHQPDLVNLYGCDIGAETTVGPFVEIQREVVIGERCKISSHSFICTGVVIGFGVFIGHGVMFINDRFPEAVSDDGSLKGEADWELMKTRVGDRASIGSNATILGGVTIGVRAFVGAGAVVSADVPEGAVVVGVPARVLRYRDK
jgi:acetyltransferase-like isoleucine patch superfamily enzyme